MHILLLTLYCILCIYGIAKLKYIRKSGINPAMLQLLFAIHAVTGWIHNAIAWRFYPGHGDVWDNFEKSFMYRHRLLYQRDLWLADNASWTHITHNGIIYIQMLLNCFSLDNLAINTLLFSFLVFLGNIALFRVFRRRFPDDPLTAFTVFLFPSALFWTACIHREGVLYMLLGFFLLNIQHLIGRGFDWRSVGSALLCFIGMAYFRIAFAITLLPPVFIWLVARKRRGRRKTLIVGTAILIILMILILPVIDLPALITHRQQEFIGLRGSSRISLPILDGTWQSLLNVLPFAIRNGWFEPLPGAGGQVIYWAFAVELLAVWMIVIAATLRTIRNRKNQLMLTREPLLTPFALFCLVFSLLGMLVIGSMIPFIGAIVRYRSIYLLFLLAPCLHSLRTLPFIQAVNERLSRHLSYRL